MSEAVHRFSRQASVDEHNAPAITVRFFYESLLAVDDPLSPVPPPQSGSTPSSKLSPRPFSSYDNEALNGTWNDLGRKLSKWKEERDAEKASAMRREREERRVNDVSEIVNYRVYDISDSRSSSRRGSTSRNSLADSRRQSLVRSSAEYPRGSPDQSSRVRPGSARTALKSLDPVQRDGGIEKDSGVEGLTGTPFARVPSRKKVPTTSSKFSSSPKGQIDFLRKGGSDVDSEIDASGNVAQESVPASTPRGKVPVGVSRVHQVVMPELRMEPIYWSPVHDIVAVVRATWFYKDSMLPVEGEVANMLEAGYLRLRPWTQTWEDELNSAVEVGALGEEKLLQRLWPELPSPKASSRPSSAMGPRSTPVQEDPEQLRSELLDTACGFIDSVTPSDNDNKAAGIFGIGNAARKRYLNSGIIYANQKEAYILRPNLQPSAYHGRRPLANYIRKGHGIGICVVRGFDQAVWDKLHPPKRGQVVAAAEEGVSSSEAGRQIYKRMKSDPSLSRSSRPQVTDLILVIHGIGQKLSERVESFHFTHAMNAFRREVNVELGTPQVKSFLRQDMGGIMVLPVNWRSTMSFEDGGYRDDFDDQASNEYTLRDITPETLSSVRNIVSDVMLDIPYYLSHHQPTMIAAVVREANRIHKLWCINNPGFEEYGRVHLIAHSLGSVMALDILSRQPTSVRATDIEVNDQSAEYFNFDTKNLFLAGSPAGFFLLLKSATLRPRKNRNKPSADGNDLAADIAGEEGTYGCVAVDNIYNIINPYDPVAYRMNATVDSAYSASLKQVFIPTATSSWFSMGNPFKAASTVAHLAKPGLPLRLPSNVELETHNFTREEIAEKRFFLLNDNGQIDYFLRYGGGPLDIQYLTMLGAHSSYWITKDFVRFIVLETGRRLGKEGTLEALRAVKKKSVGR